MTTPAPAATRPRPATWPPSQAGPCARCHRTCARYGAPANPLCETCREERRAQYGT